MKQTAWLIQRAALALVLMVSFYALALAIAGALVWVPYEAYVNNIRFPIRLALVCVGLAGTIVWAVSLLGDPQRWERRLLAAGINEEWARSLTPVTWDKVIETVYVPMWRQEVKEHASQLAGALVSRPSFAGKLTDAVARGRWQDADQAVMARVQLTATALSLALHTAGWQARTAPGEAIVFRRGEQEVQPFAELMAVATGKIRVDAWGARCAALGIDGAWAAAAPHGGRS